MKPTSLMILLLSLNTLAQSSLLYANNKNQRDDKPTQLSLMHQTIIPRKRKQIFQDDYGTWFLSKHKGKKGGCAVSYNSGFNQLTLLGPTEKHNGAFIFSGPYIPKTTMNQQLDIVMRTDQTEISTKATLLSNLKKGILLVPATIVKIIPDMEDEGAIEILLKGKTIYASSISGGFRARDALMSCIKS